jgi:bifunctional NMN adenylyltransferase/nudix hydrolase
MKKYSYAIFIARLQPFHIAHYELLKIALEQAETVIVVIGSYKRTASPRNPFSGEERETMLRAALSKEENDRVRVLLMRDSLYNDNLWLASLTQRVAEITNYSDDIILVGHNHDSTSYYLDCFPQWKSYFVPNIGRLPHATKIRELYFLDDPQYKQYVHKTTVSFLEEFRGTDKYARLETYFDAIEEYKALWKGAPFPPTFSTVDAVVIKSGHILLVRRGGTMGEGQLALPGGFLNQKETLKVGALRELREETGLSIQKEELDKAIKGKEIFDAVERSERGRTITTAFLIDLGSVYLPKIKSGDDAKSCSWMPLNEVFSIEEEFFEDHFFIISYFLGSPFSRAV